MSNYELTVVLPEKATPAKEKSVSALVEKLVNTFGGKVKSSDKWGKLPFAYTISKNNAGIYLHFVLQLEPKGAKDLEQKIRLEEGIIRYLLVKED